MNSPELLNEELRKEAARIEESAELSGKSHYNAAARWRGWHIGLGVFAALSGAIASGAALANYQWISSAFAAASTALATVLTSLRPSDKANEHKIAADKYFHLRNNSRVFRNIKLCDEFGDINNNKTYLLHLSERQNELNGTSPGIPRKDYKLSCLDINEGRNIHKVDRS